MAGLSIGYQSPVGAPAAISPLSGPVGTVFSVNLPAGAACQWTLNGAPISGATSSTYTAGATGALGCQITLAGVTVAAAAVVLNTLTLSTTNFPAGVASPTVLATISGQTAGSTISISAADTSGFFAVNGAGTQLLAGLNYANMVAGATPTVALVETLAGAANSPKLSAISATIVNAATVVSAAVRLTDSNGTGGAGTTNNYFTSRIAEKTNVAGSGPWIEGWNGGVSATSEYAIGSLAQIAAALLTNISGTGIPQTGATASQFLFTGVAGATGGSSTPYIWNLAGVSQSYAQLVAAGGYVSSDHTKVGVPSGWRYRSDPLTGISLSPQQRYYIQYEEAKFAKQTLTSLVVSGTTATATLGNTTFLAVGDSIVIGGSTNVIPGTFTVTGTTSTTFTFSVPNGTTQGADTGTITAGVGNHVAPLTENLGLGDLYRNDTTGGHTTTLDWTPFYNPGQNGSGTLLPGPCAMYMTSASGEGAVAIHGDSIAWGVGDRSVEGPTGGFQLGDADGSMAFLGRWLNRQGYSFTRHAIPSTSATNSTGNYGQRGLSARFAKTHLSEMGHNDGLGSTLASYQAVMKPWWAMLRAINGTARIVQTTLTPSVSGSSDQFKTRSGQTGVNPPSAAQYTVFQPYLLGTLNPSSGDPDAAVDVNTLIQELDGVTTLTGAWPANGAAYGATQEGTHPSGGGHSATANALGALGQSYATSKLGFTPLSSRTSTAPAQPLFVVATAQAGAIVISWGDASDGGSPITARKLYRGSTSGGETLLATINNGYPIGNYTDTVPTGTTEYYKLSAVNSVGESVISAEVTATAA